MSSTSTSDPAVDGTPHEERRSAPSSALAATSSALVTFVRANRGPCAVFAAAVVVLVTLSLRSVFAHAPLGHDESVYALRGSYYSGHSSETRAYFAPYRAPGLPYLLGFVFRITGPSDVAARVTVMAFAMVFLFAVFAIGTLLASPWTGACAAVLTAATTTFARFASLVFVDVAGIAVATLAVAAGLWWWRGERLARPAYIVVPVLGFIATQIRFGAPVTIASGLVAVVLMVGYRADSGQRRRVAIEASVLGFLTAAACGFVLFTTTATAQAVSPFAAQRAFRDAKEIPRWNSLGDLPRLIIPNNEIDDMFHPVVFGLFVIGTAVALFDAARRRSSVQPGVAFTLIGGVLAVVALNFNLSHLEGQYLLAALPFGAVLAAIGLVSLWRSIATSVPRAGIFLIILAIGLAGFMTLRTESRLDQQNNALEKSFRVIADAGSAIRALDRDDCIVVSGTTPQAGWYSQCAGTPFVTRSSDVTLGDRIRSSLRRVPEPGPTFVLFPNSGKRQPTAEVVEGDESLSVVIERGAPGDGPRQWVRVFAVDDCVLEDSCQSIP